MTTFPVLKTSAVAQYPAKKSMRFQNQILRFVDGTEQRHRDAASALHRWEIQLSQLDEGELAALEEFFAANQGAFGNFTFTDPWDQHIYPNCSLLADILVLTSVAEMRGSTSLTVVENRP
jgi:hypothetical protein